MNAFFFFNNTYFHDLVRQIRQMERGPFRGNEARQLAALHQEEKQSNTLFG